MAVYPSKRTKGRWVAEASYTDPITGRRRYVRETVSSKVEARKAERALRRQVAADLSEGVVQVDPDAPEELSLGALERLLAPTLWQGLKSEDGSLRRLRAAVDTIGRDTPVSQITTSTLDHLVTRLRSRGVSGATCNRYLNAVNKLLKAGYARRNACGERLVPQLPDSSPWQRESAPRSRYLTEDERKGLLVALRAYPVNATLGAASAAFALISLKTGARRSEIIGVSPKTDLIPPVVNGETGEIEEWGRVFFRDTKGNVARDIPIDDETYALFMEFAPWGKPQTGVKRFSERLYDAWEHAKGVLGLSDDPQFTPHVLRHSHATMLVDEDVPLPVIQQQLGHRQIATTQRYAHVTDKARIGATAKVAARLRGLTG